MLLLSGCSLELPGYLQMFIASYIPTHFDDMEYARPDVDALLESADAIITGADDAEFEDLYEDIIDCMMLYHEFVTGYLLAEIYYCKDTTDIYWTDEYNYCMDTESEVSAAIDQMMYALAASPHRETLETDDYFGAGYFDDYEGESLWDDTFTAMMDQEAELEAKYYELSASITDMESPEFYDEIAPQLCEVYVDLVLLRQEIAAYAGYESYHQFAYDYYYGRDYTPDQEKAYLEAVQQELVPLYRQLDSSVYSNISIYSRTEEETFAYVESMANNMGGLVQEAFNRMDKYGLYDISYSENKFDGSFEAYLTLYSEPYVFVNPMGADYDFLTFAHEFGHFCNDYASYGTVAGVDVAEIFSQGMEYLSLFYAETDNSLELLQMLSSISVYVEQSAYADFEMRAYSMTPEELTVENIFALVEEVAADYGLDLWGMEGEYLVTVPHFYIAPCYIFSYVVSNDAAIQFYQLELEESGTGLAKLEENLDTLESSLLAFLESADLESPFDEGRLQSVADTFREVFGIE